MDHIQQLLVQTGWSCEDLMQKLSEFKQKSNSELSNKSIAEHFSVTSNSNGYEAKSNGNNEEILENIPVEKDNQVGEEYCDGYQSLDEVKINGINSYDDRINVESSDLVIDEHNIDKPSESVINSISIVDRLKSKLDNSFENKNIESLPEPNDSHNVHSIKKINGVKLQTFDHTYIRTRRHLRHDKDLSSPRNVSLRKIKRARKNCFLLRSRHCQRLQAKHKRTNRKLLIAQYKCPEVVRSEILKQLELLRSRKTNFQVQPTITINDPFVNKKRYLPTKTINRHFEPTASCSSTNFNRTEILEVSDDSLNTTKDCDIIVENGIEIGDTSIEMMDYYNIDDAQEESSIKNIIIADVRGGCEILPDSSKESINSTENCDPQDHTIKPTKTSDITKIKGWKTKKFEISEKSPNVINELSDSNPAFASSDLDGFLAAAGIDISVKLPILRCPTPPKKPPETMLLPEVEDDENEEDLLQVQEVDSMNLYRPRTLGQKKRIMKLKYDNKGKREGQKPRTLAEKRRLLDSQYGKRFKDAPKPTNDDRVHSYILHRGKRLKVHTKTKNDIIAHIKGTYGKKDYIYVPKKPRNLKAKPSIFKNTFSPTSPVLKYRPGPLCKKPNLQIENMNWRTVVKRLPKITLGIIPRFKKPIDPKIVHLLPKYDFEITPDRLEFALTAVKSQDDTVKMFEINIPYQNNQIEIVLRSKTDEIIPEIKIPEELSIKDTCKDIVGKMLDYLEIKEISDEVIKNDVNTQLLSEDKFECKQATTTTKKRKKQSKTNYELKRLNVKVIEVNLEEKEDIKDCKKDFCLLGCVCNSLSTTSSLLANHCGRPDCMFGCVCNYQKKSKGNVKVTLPIGTDLLSEGAVNRLEVEAKRNLAKVEKEFTQTVIQANNQTIVVGGCTNRQRRVTKLPKKYNDFIEDPEVLIIEEEKFEAPAPEEPKSDLDNWKPRQCFVSIQNLRLDQIIPFCLVHNLYDCHCEYKSQFPPTPSTMEVEKSVDNPTVTNEPEIITLMISNQPQEQSESKVISKPNDKMTIMPYYTERFEINYCARTRGIPTQYYVVRNRTERFITTRDRKFLRDMSRSNLSVKIDSDPNNSMDTLTVNDRNKRRKQELVVKEDLSEAPIKKTNPKKMKKKPPDEPTMKTVDKTAILKFRKLFPTARKDHNYFSPSPDITQKFLSLLARKEGTIFYLLQWQVLANGYQRNTIQLWYSTYFKVPKIVITDSLMLPKYFTNIKKYEKVSNKNQIKNDIIRALVTGTVPGGNSKDDMQVILELSQIYCQVHGTIKKNQDKQENLVLATEMQKKSPKIIKVESLFRNKLLEEPASVASNETILTNENCLSINKRDLPIVRKIMFKKHMFFKQKLSIVSKDDETTEQCKVTAHLPLIKDGCLWRMIKLNSDFNVLSLTRNSYSIKYSDIQKVLKMAMEKNMTIVLKTEAVSKNYPHRDFGIYVSPNVENAFFVGPYYELERHDISTFRYLNRELIHTEAFNKMKGLPPTNIGDWFKQVVDEVAVEKALTIDLTESDHEDAAETTEKLLFNLNDFDYYEFTADDYSSNQMLIQDDVSANIPTILGDIYFVPNIAPLGFILGHKLTGDAVLLRWPVYQNVLKFRTYTNAALFLQREMEATFIVAPDFHITITISSESNGNIFNPNYLKGYYIVSEKGFTNVLDVTKTTLLDLKLTQQQLEDLVKRRACKLVYDNCYHVAKALFSKLDMQRAGSTSHLVKMMHTEIQMLEQQNKEYLSTVYSLSKTKEDVLNHFRIRAEELWPFVNSKFKSKLTEVLKSHGKSLNIPEKPIATDGVICIDIDDDDDVDVEEPLETTIEVNRSNVAVEKLPIYTKNPSMIITANINDRPAVDIIPKMTVTPDPKIQQLPIPKITIKNIKDLKDCKIVNNVTPVVKDSASISKDTTSISKDTTSILKDTVAVTTPAVKPRKYLLKTSSGAVIEIQADQYTKLRAQSTKSSPKHIAIRKNLVAIAPKVVGKVISDQAVLTKITPSQLRKFTLKPTASGGGFVKLVSSPSKIADVTKSCSATNPNSDNDR